MKNALPFSSPAGQESPTSGLRAGFGMIEIIVAMILLAVSVTALAGLAYSVSQSSMKVTGSAFRNGILIQELNRLETLPYDSLHASASPATTTVSTGTYAHTRSIWIAEPSTNLKTVKLVITPVNTRFKPDTVNFTRTRPRTTRVLNTVLQ